jgi:hypothetical protein
MRFVALDVVIGVIYIFCDGIEDRLILKSIRLRVESHTNIFILSVGIFLICQLSQLPLKGRLGCLVIVNTY